jgi:phosphate transport system ATP-binding protein
VPSTARPRISVRQLDALFGSNKAVRDVSIDFPDGQVTAIIGPSGCGKSTLLRCLNRLHETVPLARVSGEVLLDGRNLYGRGVNPIEVRRHIGMVFQRPTPFPTMSIRDNVPRVSGLSATGLRVAMGGGSKPCQGLSHGAFRWSATISASPA